MVFVRRRRVLSLVLAGLALGVILACDRTIVERWRRPEKDGGLNMYLIGPNPSPCYTKGLTTYMDDQHVDVVAVVPYNASSSSPPSTLPYVCSLVKPTWGMWGPANETSCPHGVPRYLLPMPSCSSLNITIPCPLSSSSSSSSSLLPDMCDNSTICIPDCLRDIYDMCTKIAAPYTGIGHVCQTHTIPQPMIDLNIFLYVLYAVFSALGIGFFVVYGLALRKVSNSLLRTRAITTWLAVSYFFISWYPHMLLHDLYVAGTSYDLNIMIEIVFHWPLAIAAGVLCYYQYDMLVLCYESVVLKQQFGVWRSKNRLPFYADFRVQAGVALVVFWAIYFIVQIMILPLPLGPDPGINIWPHSQWTVCWPAYWQQFFLTMFKIIDSLIGAIGFGFIFISVRIIRELPPSRQRRISIISSICIWLILAILGFHTFIHYAAPPCIEQIITIDLTVHITVIAVVSFLGYYQIRILDMIMDPTSPFHMAAGFRKASRSGTSSNNSSHHHHSPPQSLHTVEMSGSLSSANLNMSIASMQTSASSYDSADDML
eukprot:TRINITY_DN8772_c0_g1_i1.p1 TRINITY_DN8772_c0_g1~~TRINITY_DN8772_c0_g1_i1.p1  ORF type:complete len:542 (-),score=83.25 TRINITY_DN8772_c0_g1_i1:38-1663(-)